jgi:hypothetical protein
MTDTHWAVAHWQRTGVIPPGHADTIARYRTDG